jgi:catechol 2,3-dioxygenase-like lactoylglutathione lyase family enzyme
LEQVVFDYEYPPETIIFPENLIYNLGIMAKKSTLLRMDNVGIMVEDLEVVVAFFIELGLTLEGTTTVEGTWVDRVIGIDGAKCDIAMLRTPDGHSRIELSKFQKPKAIPTDPNTPVNTLGIRRLMFAVTDLDEVLARLEKKHGATLVDEVVQYEDMYRLCYLRGPEGIMIALAEQLGEKSVADILET